MSNETNSSQEAGGPVTELTCTYDPLKEFLAHYADAKSVKHDSSSYTNMTVEEKLKHRIIDGDKLGLDDDLRSAMKTYSALEIINDILLGGMKVVGELFGAGEMQLPFVLQSAETMKAAVKFLEPFMEKLEGEQSKGVMVLATVKGDVHDIGKNLVDIILTNNGYRVVNLGIKVALEPMLAAAEAEHADAIGMSGLLVKSTAIMKENLEVMQSRNIRIPVVLGGAALNRKFVEKDLRALYDGPLSYAQDAFDGLHFMERLKNPQAAKEEVVETEPRTASELTARMEAAHKEFVALLASVPPEDYLIPEAFGEWSLRDVVAHIIGWQRLGVERLNLIKSGGAITPISGDEVDDINARFVREVVEATRHDLIDSLDAIHHELRELTITLSEEEIERSTEETVAVWKWLPQFSDKHLREHGSRISAWLETKEEELDNATGAESKIVMAARTLPWLVRPATTTNAAAKSAEVETMQEQVADFPVAVRKIETDAGTERLVRTSATPHDNPIPTPPFWGSRVVDDIKLEKVWEYLNEVALFRGQWQMKRGKRSVEDYTRETENIARPKLQEVKLRAKRDRVLEPKVVYGYFPCYSEGEDLVVLKPKGMSDQAIYERWQQPFGMDDLEEWSRFTFPRQRTERRLCLADFYLPREEAHRRNQPDVVTFTAVTVGRGASEYTAQLFADNNYADYLFMHGLSVETAEALAEYWHKVVRTELGIAGNDAKEITRLFSQGYQGSRYSFGYPACPRLEDQTKLFDLIRPERIDITLTEEYHLEPEQSTTAIVTHHPAAKYFAIK
jgi:cobalamin-dependent methionine synthase I